MNETGIPVLHVTVKPWQEQGQITYLDVTAAVEGMAVNKGEEVFRIQKETVSIPFCPVGEQGFILTDEEGNAALYKEEIKQYPITYEVYRAGRDLKGSFILTYRFYPRTLPENYRSSPYFDFRCEKDGANGAGITFLPKFPIGTCQISFQWDLKEMPEGSKGIWSEDYRCEEEKMLVDQADILLNTYYAVGAVKTIEQDGFAFHWIAPSELPFLETADRVKKLYGYMKEFFQDSNANYQVFVRKDPFEKSGGGTALTHSFMFGYNEKHLPTVDDLQNLLSHEMVHNWPHIDDNPYGSATWYNEGTAEFYSVMLPYRAGIVSKEDTLFQIRKRSKEYYANPTGKLGNMEAAAICWEDRRAQRVAYGRGFFFLAKLDAGLRRLTGDKFSLDNVVKELLVEGYKRGADNPLTCDDFRKVYQRFSGQDISEDIKSMEEGELIVPDPDSFDRLFTCVEVPGKYEGTEEETVTYEWELREGKKLLDYDDLEKVNYLSAPAVSPDGRYGAYVIRHAHKKTGFMIPHLYELKLNKEMDEDGVIPWQENLGSCQDLPAYSPDGRYLAYLCNGEVICKEQPPMQIWIYDREEGRSQQITTARHGVKEFVWSPDSRTLAFTASWWKEEEESGEQFTEMTPEEREKWKKEKDGTPVIIENLMYKLDEAYGVLDQSISHICTVDLKTGFMKACTKGTGPYEKPVWSADGRKLAFYGKPYSHIKERTPAIFTYDAETEDMRQLDCKDMLLDDQDPVLWGADENIIFAAYEKEECGSYLRWLFGLNSETGEIKSLFTAEKPCHDIGTLALGRTACGNFNPAYQLNKERNRVYFRSAYMGQEAVYCLELQGHGEVRRITKGKYSVLDFCGPAEGKLLMVRGNTMTIGELYVMGVQTEDQMGNPTTDQTKYQKRLTWSNNWLNEYCLSVPQEMWVERDGVKIHGYFLLPQRKDLSSLGGEEKAPGVLDIHGGPGGFYSHDFWFEFQMMAARGFAAIYCDPRGSAGYGPEFASGKYSWGQESMDDLMSFTDAVIETGAVAPDKLGVTGGSYGGHMTNRIIGTSTRFKAAVSQRNLCNLATSYGTGDQGFIWSEEGTESQMNNFIERVKKSPIKNIDSMKTPLLILHGEKDYRCSLEQAEQLFIAMKERNPEIPVRMVIFPGENHGLTRDGRLFSQIGHLKEMITWFELYVKAEKEVES
jgi:dipeptidyl aminopeptidase/acylaminoacyl peptidase